MNVRSLKYALAVAGALTLASSAFAQSDTAQRRIRLSKSEGTVQVPARVDTVIVTRDVTNTVVKTDTVMVLRQVIPAPIKSKFGPGFYLALDGGGLFPQDELKSIYSAGPQFDGMIGYQGIRIPLGARLAVGYGKTNERSGVTVGDMKDLSVNGDVTWRIPLLASNWRPAVYVLGGAGWHRLTFDADDTAGVPSTTQNQYGLRGGAGFTLGVGAANLFVEGRYEWINTDGSGSAAKLIPVVVGLQFF